MKKFAILFVILLVAATGARAQKVAIKNNVLADITTSANLAVEFSVAKHFSIEIYGSWNQWDVFGENTRMRHVLIQPEFRYWFCESFNGWFIGAHIVAMPAFNFGGMALPGFSYIKNFRYEGYLYGAGLAGGYQWIVGKRWNIEAAIGVGGVWGTYEKFDCGTCGDLLSKGDWGIFPVPTKLSLSAVFFFN